MVKTPEWVKHTVWYQIFPERFANGDKSNDPKNVKPWNPSDHPGREDYYGGDLQGVLDHLDYLKKLGVNGLYFCPILRQVLTISTTLLTTCKLIQNLVIKTYLLKLSTKPMHAA